MPAEWFLFTLIGAGLLIWAAHKEHLNLKLLAWGLGLTVGFLAASQALAVVTGLALDGLTPRVSGGFWSWCWSLHFSFVISWLLKVVSSCCANYLDRALNPIRRQP